MFICSLSKVLRSHKSFVQGGSRPMWLNKNSPSCCKRQLFFSFLLEEQRSGIYIYFLHQGRFSVPFLSCFCSLASWVISGWWLRICLSDQTMLCTLREPPGAGKGQLEDQLLSLGHFFFIICTKSEYAFIEFVGSGCNKCCLVEIWLRFIYPLAWKIGRSILPVPSNHHVQGFMWHFIEALLYRCVF